MPLFPDDWSPADHPYAIAVSEAQWWQSATRLAAARLDEPADLRSSPMGSHQIDARNLVLALAQLLTAERLEQLALSELGVEAEVGASLANSRREFLELVPGIQEMRNSLTHFDEWSRGAGRGEQKRAVDAGGSQREVASNFWGFGYDPGTRTIAHGPQRIEVDVAVHAAADLAWAIGTAARKVDQLSIASSKPAGLSAPE